MVWNHNSPLFVVWPFPLPTMQMAASRWGNHHFFKFANFSQGHHTWSKPLLFLCGELGWFDLPTSSPSSLFSLFFLFFLWHSPPPSLLHILDISFVIYILDQSDHSDAFSLSSQITPILNLNWVKDIPSWDFVWGYIIYPILHLHDILTWCQHIISLLILSAASFFKNHGSWEQQQTTWAYRIG